METIKQHYLRIYARDQNILSIACITNVTSFSPIIDGFDLLVLIVVRNLDNEQSTHHYIKDGWRIQERRIAPAEFEQWIVVGENRNIIQWVLQGEIMLDRECYMENIRHRLLEFPEEIREKKLLFEFILFLKSYLQSKQYIEEGHILDAYSNILEALRHWARIAIIETGHHPEVTVWSQVRKLNPGVYKLFEELTSSPETMEQRVKLVLLASEFSIMAKMEQCCAVLLRILESREEPWSIEELRNLPQLKELHSEFGLLLNKMVHKSLIREVVVTDDQEFDVMELKYTFVEKMHN